MIQHNDISIYVDYIYYPFQLYNIANVLTSIYVDTLLIMWTHFMELKFKCNQLSNWKFISQTTLPVNFSD